MPVCKCIGSQLAYASRKVRNRASQEIFHVQPLGCSIYTRFKQWIESDVQQKFSSFDTALVTKLLFLFNVGDNISQYGSQ